jgi:hypothetical protein
MSVAEYCALTGLGEDAVREDIKRDRIPHRLVGKRNRIRILRIPALAQLGAPVSIGDGTNGKAE